MTDKDDKKTVMWGRRTVKGLYYISNVFLPLSEIRYTVTKIGSSHLNTLKRIRRLYDFSPQKEKTQQPILNFNEAVIASGMSIDTLKHRFLGRKKWCLVLAAIPSILAISILFMVLLSGVYTPQLLLKSLVLILALLSIAALLFVQALICSWRLWQLCQHRASPTEKGEFSDFLSENSWIKATIKLKP
ncbi:conjugal transfer protein TraX (plasmid) [Xenorhabdus stockiae]|uniref:conjugal transfer protein TraX n=1 Tax=Xenorhabdus stockiae TaxID=351614 RepID=UPI003CEA40D0